MRNNPIAEIPAEISRLKHLSMLVVSYCLISNLPSAYVVVALKFLGNLYGIDSSRNIKVLSIPWSLLEEGKNRETPHHQMVLWCAGSNLYPRWSTPHFVKLKNQQNVVFVASVSTIDPLNHLRDLWVPHCISYTLQPHYNMVVYSTNSVITRWGLGFYYLYLLYVRPSL